MSKLMTTVVVEKTDQITQPQFQSQDPEEPDRRIIIAAAYDFERDPKLAEYVPLIGRIAKELDGIARVFATTELPSGMGAQEKHDTHSREIKEADLILLHPKVSEDVGDMVSKGLELGKPFIPFYGEQVSIHQSMLRMLERKKCDIRDS